MDNRITGQALPGYITTTNCKEYEEGERAFNLGLDCDSCPYPKGDTPKGNGKRLDWFNGFFLSQDPVPLGTYS